MIQRASPSRSKSGGAVVVSSSSEQVTSAGKRKAELKQVADPASLEGLSRPRVWLEKRVPVDGKLLREGKRSDFMVPESGQAVTDDDNPVDAKDLIKEFTNESCEGNERSIDRIFNKILDSRPALLVSTPLERDVLIFEPELES